MKKYMFRAELISREKENGKADVLEMRIVAEDIQHALAAAQARCNERDLLMVAKIECECMVEAV